MDPNKLAYVQGLHQNGQLLARSMWLKRFQPLHRIESLFDENAKPRSAVAIHKHIPVPFFTSKVGWLIDGSKADIAFVAVQDIGSILKYLPEDLGYYEKHSHITTTHAKIVIPDYKDSDGYAATTTNFHTLKNLWQAHKILHFHDDKWHIPQQNEVISQFGIDAFLGFFCTQHTVTSQDFWPEFALNVLLQQHLLSEYTGIPTSHFPLYVFDKNGGDIPYEHSLPSTAEYRNLFKAIFFNPQKIVHHQDNLGMDYKLAEILGLLPEYKAATSVDINLLTMAEIINAAQAKGI